LYYTVLAQMRAGYIEGLGEGNSDPFIFLASIDIELNGLNIVGEKNRTALLAFAIDGRTALLAFVFFGSIDGLSEGKSVGDLKTLVVANVGLREGVPVGLHMGDPFPALLDFAPVGSIDGLSEGKSVGHLTVAIFSALASIISGMQVGLIAVGLNVGVKVGTVLLDFAFLAFAFLAFAFFALAFFALAFFAFPFFELLLGMDIVGDAVLGVAMGDFVGVIVGLMVGEPAGRAGQNAGQALTTSPTVSQPISSSTFTGSLFGPQFILSYDQVTLLLISAPLAAFPLRVSCTPPGT